MDEREEKIIENLKSRAKTTVKYGHLTIKFTVHDGVIVKGEVIEEKIFSG